MTMSDDTQQAYSLENLKDWVNDAIESECTPKEIYDSIIDTVKNSRKYHKACYDDGTKLLSLLRGHPDGITIVGDPEGVPTHLPQGVTSLPTDYYTSSMFDLTSPCLIDSDPNHSDNVVISGESGDWPDYTEIPEKK